MLIGDNYVFVELQKTGSTHIKQQLQALLGGRSEGKHNKPSDEQLGPDRVIIGSVRDPWSWYLSLWSYGCQRRGSLYTRLVDPQNWQHSLPLMQSRQREHGDLMLEQLTPQRAHDVWYADTGSGEGFREWLRALCLPEMRTTVQSGFEASGLGRWGCGMMSYRYLKLFTRGVTTLAQEVHSDEELREWARRHFRPAHMIRLHALAEDLIATVQALGGVLSPEQCEALRQARPTNRSSRPHPFGHYYDAQSLDEVARREWLLIERHGFQRPSLG